MSGKMTPSALPSSGESIPFLCSASGEKHVFRSSGPSMIQLPKAPVCALAMRSRYSTVSSTASLMAKIAMVTVASSAGLMKGVVHPLRAVSSCPPVSTSIPLTVRRGHVRMNVAKCQFPTAMPPRNSATSSMTSMTGKSSELR